MDIARTEYVRFDVDGKPVDADSPDWYTAERTDYDADGNVILRSYLINEPMPPEETDVDPIDDAIESPPVPWELAVEDDDGVRPVDDLATLIEFLGGDRVGPDRLSAQIATVTLLPSWGNAPAQLQREVYAYLAG